MSKTRENLTSVQHHWLSTLAVVHLQRMMNSSCLKGCWGWEMANCKLAWGRDWWRWRPKGSCWVGVSRFYKHFFSIFKKSVVSEKRCTWKLSNFLFATTDKQRQTSSLRRNVLYPVAMLLLIGLTGIAVLSVIQNTLLLLIGIKALPSSTRVTKILKQKSCFLIAYIVAIYVGR